jgi:hypothetical protein
MQRVFAVAAALVLFACGTTFAQSPTTRSTALMGLTNPTIQSTAPGGLTNPTLQSTAPGGLTNPTPSVGAVGGGLGAIQPNLGSLIPPPGGALGSITTCPMTGMANPTTDTSVGGLPGTTTGTSAIAPFGTSGLAGTCSPSTPTIAPGFSNPAPPPSPGTITGSAFSDGALPLDVTEAGGAGLSPIIAVPDPATSATSCNGGSTMMATPSLPTLFDNAGATSISSPYGC